MADMETLLPRTCQKCYGASFIYYGNNEDFDSEVCECKGS